MNEKGLRMTSSWVNLDINQSKRHLGMVCFVVNIMLNVVEAPLSMMNEKNVTPMPVHVNPT